MLISLNWIKDFVSIPEKTDPNQLGQLFTLKAAEVEHIENQAKTFEKMVVGQVIKSEKHPNADKLTVNTVHVGKEKLQMVCGAPNVKEGMLVAVALPGAMVKWHGQGDPMKLEKVKLRGVESNGMICAGEEIGLDPTPGEITDLSHLNVPVGTPLASALGKDDTIIDIDNKSLTHRPDLWSHYGIAREMSAITKSKLKPYKTNTNYSEKKDLSIEVKEAKLCPRYIGVVMEGIKIEPSPEWMQKRLLAIGYRPINNIVDITNYVMAEVGQPLHAFDAKKIEGGIIVRKAKDKEEVQTLDEEKRKLNKETLVIADHKKAIAIAGVMGCANSEIDEKTTNIIIESANFNPSSVRKTSMHLGLRTEAVQRFEKSLDPVQAETAIDKVCELILEICPSAKITSSKIDVSNFNNSIKSTTLDLNRVKSKIGANVQKKQAKEILESLQFKVEDKGNDTFHVKIPSFRATKDVSMEDDLIEEIARLYGYENVEPTLPDLPIRLPKENTERKLKHKAREIMSKGLGFDEVQNYSFYSKKDIQKSMLPEELHILVENYLSEDQTHLRVSLVPNMLKNVALNLKNFEKFNIYEVGRTYEDLQEYFPIEEKKICAMMVNNKKSKGNFFYETKGVLESLLGFFETDGIKMKKGESLCPYAHPNKYAAYFMEDGTEIARLFELHPVVAKNYDVDNAIIHVFTVNFTRLAQLGARNTKYKQIPKHPGIKFDISVIIDKTVPIEKMQEELMNSNKDLVTKVLLFDLFEGSNIPEDKKSCGFEIFLQAEDRTLTDDDMKKIQQDCFKRLQKLGGEIRGLE